MILDSPPSNFKYIDELLKSLPIIKNNHKKIITWHPYSELEKETIMSVGDDCFAIN